MTMPNASRDRRPRSDGLRSRRTILQAAARLATTHGLDRLSIADLAEHAGMSKSGLYAHFGSKEELQLATVDTANEIFDAEVTEPASRAAPGIDRLSAIADRYIDHLERRVFPGGCFFASAAAELRDQPGPVRGRIAAFHVGWMARLLEHALIARDHGQLAPDEDVDQLAFDLESAMIHAHSTFSFSGDRTVLDLARRAIQVRLGRG
jgi:AcrR family transcriptional regulator